MNLTSAAGIISLLEEEEPELKVYALRKLDQIVDNFWPEISDAISKIEILYEDKAFPEKQLSALVASKVYYHLGSFEDSVTFALGAGDLFDVNGSTEYIETIISKCIDQYTKLRVHNAECHQEQDKKAIDPRLEAIVNRMFDRCFIDGKYRQAIGIALETRRLDVFRETIVRGGGPGEDRAGLLLYSTRTSLALVQSRSFLSEVLRTLVDIYNTPQAAQADATTPPDYINMAQCLIFLDDAPAVADILDKLLKKTEEEQLMAYQIAFDLYESASQQFLTRVLQSLRSKVNPPTAAASGEATVNGVDTPTTTTSTAGDDSPTDTTTTTTGVARDDGKENGDAIAMDTNEESAAADAVKKESAPEPTFELLENPARVMRAQLKVISMPEGARYAPLKSLHHGGIILMRDSTKHVPEDIVEKLPAGGPKVDTEKEPEPPEPFQYTEDE